MDPQPVAHYWRLCTDHEEAVSPDLFFFRFFSRKWLCYSVRIRCSGFGREELVVDLKRGVVERRSGVRWQDQQRTLQYGTHIVCTSEIVFRLQIYNSW